MQKCPLEIRLRGACSHAREKEGAREEKIGEKEGSVERGFLEKESKREMEREDFLKA